MIKSGFLDQTQRMIFLKFDWQPGSEYKLKFPSGTFTDKFGVQNRKLERSMKILTEDQYGALKLIFSNESGFDDFRYEITSKEGKVLINKELGGILEFK